MRATGASRHPKAGTRQGHGAGRLLRTAALCVGAVALAALAARVHWEDVYITPESGPGYALGVAGLAMMVLLLAYSARKRLRFMREWGPVRGWFVAHMALGILGPAAILVHSRLELGSLNGTVALACTLVVAASGIAGRFIYTRVHHGLSGRRRELAEMRAAARSSRGRLLAATGSAPAVERRLEAVEALVLVAPAGLLRAAGRRLALGGRARALRRSVRSLGAGRRRECERALREYLRAVRAAAALSLWERVFSLWHVLHLPLAVLLFGSAAVHVVAVHMY